MRSWDSGDRKARVYPLDCGLGMAFLLAQENGLYLVDSGSPGQERVVLQQMRALGRADLKLIWITHAHYDHYGSAAALRAATGAPIAVHPADADSMRAGRSPLGQPRSYGWLLVLAQKLVNRLRPLSPTPPDFTLQNGERLDRFGLAAEVLHTPGHTPGHTCLLLDSGVAFAADLVARKPRTRLQSLLATDWEALPASLAALQQAAPIWTYTGHTAQPIRQQNLLDL